MSQTPALMEAGATELYVIPSKHANLVAASESDDENSSISFSTPYSPSIAILYISQQFLPLYPLWSLLLSVRL
jgi:hypothetical protein